MIPSTFTLLEALPFNKNGKVDRAALSAPDDLRQQISADYAPPKRDLERDLLAIWQDVLLAQELGVHDNFFDLGGNSLLGAEVLARIQQGRLGSVSIVDLFERPTIALLAEHLAARSGGAPEGRIEESLMDQRRSVRASVRERRMRATEDLGTKDSSTGDVE